MKIRISYKSLSQKFHPCTTEFIKNTCRGYCCSTKSGKEDCHIALTPSDALKLIKKYNVEVKDGILQTGKRCLFQDEYGFCKIHNTPEYPTFTCSLSPFILNKNNVLIVANRWRLLKCYKAKEGKIPVYLAHRRGLEIILGKEKTEFVINWIETKKTDLEIDIDDEIYRGMMQKKEILYRSLNKKFLLNK